MVVGDTILSYNGTPTPTFEALASAVHDSDGEVQVVFINSENDETETITLYPEDGRIGVSGESVPVDD